MNMTKLLVDLVVFCRNNHTCFFWSAEHWCGTVDGFLLDRLETLLLSFSLSFCLHVFVEYMSTFLTFCC